MDSKAKSTNLVVADSPCRKMGGALRSTTVEARTVTFADHLYRRVSVGVFDQPPLPNFPGGLIGMEAFRGRRVAMDLGAGALFVSRPLDLTVG